ncbi:uncharacterized protein LOC111020462 [Momordica charantia]|uniref:Uncharacterized protein LOC111020462 n=1 Tax=Momordica charantia TaxID=3673 RepID=A0A6J1DHC7_MOMCH|nr:uncharacterized protein LOC111020462 [Momordica charantia]
MPQPTGFIDSSRPHYVCKLQKSLVFVKLLENGDLKILILILDDIIVTENNLCLIQRFIDKLNNIFALKDFGHLNFFLGIEVYRDTHGIYLIQQKYSATLLKRLGFENLKPTATPTIHGKHLSAHDGQPIENPTLYRSAIGGIGEFVEGKSSAFKDVKVLLEYDRKMHLCRSLKPLRML